MLDSTSAKLETHLRATGITSAAAIQTALGISQPTLSRTIAALGPAVIRIGRARATHYAHTRDIGRHGNHWPLYRIDAEGRAITHGTLTALQGEAFAYGTQDHAELWHAGSRLPGAFAQLPWFLADLRPEGFLGQHYARRHAATLAAPQDMFVFLVALGIDYSIFLFGRIKEEVAQHGMRQGVHVAVAATGAIITSAGVILAGTSAGMMSGEIAFLSQLGFSVAVGVLIDTFIVRTILDPALAAFFGRWTWWPGGVIRQKTSVKLEEVIDPRPG